MSDGSCLQVFSSNRLEVLADHLAARIESDPPSVFESETVVVQNDGCARWLTLRLARRHGIAANLDTPLPRRFCHDLADRVLGLRAPGEDKRSFDRARLRWVIFADMASWASEERFDALLRYLADDADQRKRYQLADRLAVLFDRYQVYRPDLLLAWEEGRLTGTGSHEPWQACLWNRVAGRIPHEQHLARRLRLLIDRFREDRVRCDAFPRRVSVFAVARLAPAVVELLVALAKHVPVSFYHLQVTPEYWGDVRSPRERTRDAAQDAGDVLSAGNELLAALGRQGREFVDLLLEADSTGSGWHPLEFVEPSGGCVLHAIQRDIFAMRSPTERAEKLELSEGDRSLEVHVCSSPQREIEVLRDRLLDAFAHDPELRPDDVAIAVPDVGRYGPIIDALFGEGQDIHLPVSLPGKRFVSGRSAGSLMLALLDLVRSRLGATETLAMLDFPLVRAAFDLSAADVALLGDWVDCAMIRWGAGDDKDSAGPAGGVRTYTWQAGLERLVMGYATGEVERLVAGVAPAGAGDSSSISRLLVFSRTLISIVEALRNPRPARRWAEDLNRALDRLCVPESLEDDEAIHDVRRHLATLAEAADLLNDEPLGVEVVREYLEALLEDSGAGRFRLSGSITVAPLEVLRPIPFQVLCIVGLDSDVFPRRERRPAFDLMNLAPRRCDRIRAADDRYYFLEALCSARKRLILSYCGRSSCDGSRRAPSAVVAEVLDQVNRTFTAVDGRTAAEAITVEHPFASYSPRYFDESDDHLWSYSTGDCRAARVFAAGQSCADPFADVPVTTEVPAVIELSDLVSFWSHPSRYFCRRTLGLFLEREQPPEEDSEPFDLKGLDRFRLGQRLLARRVKGETTCDGEHAWLSGGGFLPAGELGRVFYADVTADVDRMSAQLPLLHPFDPIPVEVAGPTWKLVGAVDGWAAEGVWEFRFSSLATRALPAVWIRLLALAASIESRPDGCPLSGVVVSRNERVSIEWRDDDGEAATAILDGLVKGFLAGLSRPLPVFLNASRKFIEHRARSKKDEQTAEREAVEHACREFQRTGEANDPYVELCFRDVDPIRDRRDDFAQWSETLWAPFWQVARGGRP